jgi:outer membrane translocation and assembly module TamA
LTLAYENVDYRPMDAHPELWHLFRPDHHFRANFSTLSPLDQDRVSDVLTGRSSAMTLTFAVEPVQTGRPESGFNGAASMGWEVSGGGLGGDHDYNRLQLEARGWWTNGWPHRVGARAFYGISQHDLPPNKLFYLGGVGSLPGYPQKMLVGDQAFLLNVEYRFNYWETQIFDGGIILSFDLGRAAGGSHFWDWDQFKPDVGLGLALGEDIRVDVAKGLDDTDRDFRVRVQLAEMF